MRLNPFGSRPTTGELETSPAVLIAQRARAAQSKESAEMRRAAKRAGPAARETLTRTVEQNESDLDRALDAVARFEPTTLRFLADELDAADAITQWSILGRAATPDGGLPVWLRDRCLTENAKSVVLDWLTFRRVFRTHKEFSARAADDPLPQIYEALSLQPGESIAVEGVLTVGREGCDRILQVSLALRAAQRSTAARDIRALTGHAAADAWHAFDRVNRFVTAELAEWLVTDAPDDDDIAAQIAAGRFSTVDTTPAGRSTGIAPHDIDSAAFAADLRRSTGG